MSGNGKKTKYYVWNHFHNDNEVYHKIHFI